MKNILYKILCITLFATSAQAMWLFEPMVGYQMGTYSAESVSSPGVTSTANETGTLAGLRFGYSFSNRMFIGLEYGMLSGGKYTFPDSSKIDFTRNDAMIDIGYNWGRVRAYFGYGVLNTMTYATTPDNIIFNGTNMKVGFGYMAANHFAINLEYLMPKYTKYDAGSLKNMEVTGLYSTFNLSSYNINFSFPFMF